MECGITVSKYQFSWKTQKLIGLIAVTPATKVKPLHFSIADDFRWNTIRFKSVLVDFQPVSKLLTNSLTLVAGVTSQSFRLAYLGWPSNPSFKVLRRRSISRWHWHWLFLGKKIITESFMTKWQKPVKLWCLSFFMFFLRKNYYNFLKVTHWTWSVSPVIKFPGYMSCTEQFVIILTKSWSTT